uniref:Tenascin N n=1 Tax=Anabas testudineus TaxID=64144 RepID=A0A3Q1I7J0_ANATE
MTTRLLVRTLGLLTLLCTISHFSSADNQPSAPEQGVTFSHVYKIDVPGGSSCKLESLPAQAEADLQTETTTNGENDIIFRHNIRLQTPKCDCEESESFKSLLYRVNGLEEEVNYLKTQCAQGCCGRGGLDTSCSGHGSYQHDTCSCLCDPGWEGPGCSESSCPDDCNDNGRCVDGKCVCLEGYTGDDCSQLTCPDHCNDKGRCVDGKCVCFPHFTGEDCSIQKCPGDCKGNGRCVDGGCICDEGFYGEDCSSVSGPQGLHLVQVTDTSLLVEWESVRGAEYYVLSYHRKGDASSPEQVRIPNTENSYLITGLTPGVTYIVEVYAVIKEIQSEADKIESIIQYVVSVILISSLDIDAPTDLVTTEETEDTATVSWNPVEAEIEGYMLSYSSAEGSSFEIPVGRDSTSYRLIGLRPGVLYTVYIWAFKGDKVSTKSSTEAETELDAPANLLAQDETESSFSVSWDPVQAEIDGYKLTYSSTEGSSGEIQVGPESTSYSVTGLRPGVLYTVYIWAIKGNKVSRKTSTQAETELDAPANLLARDETESSFSVSWDPVQAEIDGYILTYSSTEGTSEEILVGPGSTSYSLTGLRPGVLYTVYVWAIKGNKVSRKISTNAETDIDSPKDLKATDVTLESAVLTWTPPLADIEGYILTYRDEAGNMEVQLGAAENSFAVSGLEMGARYIVTVIAYRGNKRSKVVETIFKTAGLQYPFPMDCIQIMKNGNKKSGIYTIYINNNRSKPLEVYCDMDTDGGGWLMLQRRTTGKLDFMKRWRQYIEGFGDMADEFWIGLDKIYELTNTPTQYELRFDLGLGSERAYAVYDNFRIAPVKQKFKLTIGQYRGTAGDAMTYHQGRPWTTIDNDNDIALGNCALTHRGAWWYKNCHLANLNGKWGDNRHSLGVNWEPWKGHLTSLDFTEMKIRPVGGLSSRKRRSLYNPSNRKVRKLA